jgi:ketosteroid isomerase-like protein
MSNTSTKSRAAIIKAHLAAGDSGDTTTQASFFTDDVVIGFGNLDPIQGKDIAESYARQFLSSLKGMRHEIHEIWHPVEDDNLAVAQMTVHYTKLDGTVVSLPCINVFRFRGDLIADDRVYMDINPVFA